VVILIFAISPFVVNFLHLPSPFLFIWIGLSFSLGLFSNIGRSFLQGMSRFFALTVSGLMEGIIRLLFTILLLYLGWGLMGATLPFFIMSIFSVFFTLFMVRDLVKGNKKEPIPEKKQIFKFVLPVFLTNLGITSLITADIILARHFLPANDAGLYSALSTLCKIIYFAAAPVVSVLFPMVSETHAAKKSITKVILPGFLIMLLIMGGALIIFGFFPKLMVTLLFGSKYVSMAPFVIAFGIGMAIYTLNACLLNIFLAVRSVLPSYLVVFAAILQIILISFFHENIANIITIFISISSLLLIILLLYYVRLSASIKKEFQL
jgi:O-antigen/teichoic acid export membrane protein